MAITYRGGFCEVVIFKDGERFDRSSYPILFNSIASVRASVQAGGFAKIDIQITPSFGDGLEILKSGLLGVGMGAAGQKPTPKNKAAVKDVKSKKVEDTTSTPKANPKTAGSESQTLQSNMSFLAVRFSYPGESETDGTPAETPWYTGLVGVPDLDMGSGEMSFTLHAHANSSLLMGLEGEFVYKNKPALDVLNDLSSVVGVKIEFDVGDTQSQAKLKSTKISGAHNEDRFTIMKKILFQLDCYFVTDSGDGKTAKSRILVKSRKSFAEGKIDYTFVQLRQIDPSNNVIPIYSFQLQSQGNLFISGAAFGSFQKGVNPSSKKVERFVFNPKDFDSKTLTGSGAGSGGLPLDNSSGAGMGGTTGITKEVANMSGSNDSVLIGDGVDTKSELKARSAKQINSFLSFKLLCPGLPRIKPLSVGQIKIGDDIPGLSGPGLIRGFDHVWDGSGGWTTEISFAQTGTAAAASRLASADNRKPEPLKKKSAGNTKVAKGISSTTITGLKPS